MNDTAPLKVLLQLCAIVTIFGILWGTLAETLKERLDNLLDRRNRHSSGR
jgi:hypothetical protein